MLHHCLDLKCPNEKHTSGFTCGRWGFLQMKQDVEKCRSGWWLIAYFLTFFHLNNYKRGDKYTAWKDTRKRSQPEFTRGLTRKIMVSIQLLRTLWWACVRYYVWHLPCCLGRKEKIGPRIRRQMPRCFSVVATKYPAERSLRASRRNACLPVLEPAFLLSSCEKWQTSGGCR